MPEILLNHDNPVAQSSSEIITDISNLSRQISAVYSLREVYPGKFLPPEDWAQSRRLHALKDHKTFDLLLQRRENPDGKISVVIQKFPGEITHPFSMNRVSIAVPSVEQPDKDYWIRTELSDLRRNGIIEDSIEAEKLLGETTIAQEPILSFIYRTNEELVKIRDNIRRAKNSDTTRSYSIEELEDLSAQLIRDRLIPLRSSPHFPPDSSLSVFMYEDREGTVLSEAASLNLRGRVFKFDISGQRIFPALNDTQGYDKIVTLIS